MSSQLSARIQDAFYTLCLWNSPEAQTIHVIMFTVTVKKTSLPLLSRCFSPPPPLPPASPSSFPLPLPLPPEVAALQHAGGLLHLCLHPPSLYLSLPTRWRSQADRPTRRTGRPVAWLGRQHADLGPPSLDLLVPPWAPLPPSPLSLSLSPYVVAQPGG